MCDAPAPSVAGWLAQGGNIHYHWAFLIITITGLFFVKEYKMTSKETVKNVQNDKNFWYKNIKKGTVIGPIKGG